MLHELSVAFEVTLELSGFQVNALTLSGPFSCLYPSVPSTGGPSSGRSCSERSPLPGPGHD